MAELLLVRHAATDWTGRRYCGSTDLPLSPVGLDVARRLARDLATSVQPGTVIVSSPLRRARQTAEALLERVPGATLRIDDRWSETDFGVAEGLTYDELAHNAPDVATQLAAGLFGIDWPGGERAVALVGRVDAALRDVLGRSTDTVIVSHGGPLRVAMAIATGRDPRDVPGLDPGHAWRFPGRGAAGLLPVERG